jgi:hypothetical protein
VAPPGKELKELLILLPGVTWGAPLSFCIIRPVALPCWEDCGRGGPPSLDDWVLSAFFLLLKRNAIVPCAAGDLECYANALNPQVFPRGVVLSASDG